jgi:N-acyl-L-homoserine lactone synthetase
MRASKAASVSCRPLARLCYAILFRCFWTEPPLPKAAHGLAGATYELFAGMIEFGLSRQITEIVTVTDARMERILRRAGWPLRRIGKARPLGDTLAIAGYLEISARALACVYSAGGLRGPVLWAPVAFMAA